MGGDGSPGVFSKIAAAGVLSGTISVAPQTGHVLRRLDILQQL
jgi:hypothetical protein